MPVRPQPRPGPHHLADAITDAGCDVVCFRERHRLAEEQSVGDAHADRNALAHPVADTDPVGASVADPVDDQFPEPHAQPVTVQRFLLGAAAVLTALLLQLTVVGRLPLPGAAPDLLLVLVVAFALAEGPTSGMITGFVAGLLADALSVHEIGRLALAYAVAGYLTGLLHDDTDRSTIKPFGVVLLGSLAALAAFSFEGVLLADPRVTVESVTRAVTSSVPYAVILTPFVVPVIAGLVRRLDVDPIRRI